MPSRRARQTVKRAADIGLGAIAFVVTLPVQAVTAVAVAVDLGRPVLFRQVRTGRDGAEFTLLKFRTMRPPAPDVTDGDRLTNLGRLLRRTSLDELPSLLNVIRGDMSLVGPRPLLPEYLPLYDAAQRRRHEMRPGVTGLAQVSGRNLLRWEDQFDLDVEYIDRWSLSLDLRILWLTVVKVLRQEGITAPGEATRGRFTGSRT